MRTVFVGTCVVACLGLGGRSLLGAVEQLVTLQIVERANVARTGEVVTMGVPLPKGRVEDAGDLTLLGPNGTPIPAEIRPICKWPGGSVKWVHLYFRTDCAAGKTAHVTLARGPRAEWRSGLRVDDGRDAVTVTTGPLKFTVRKRVFNVIDEAWVDEGGGAFDEAHRIIASHTRGAGTRVGGKEFLGINDPDVKVKVEESGPFHVVIKASGSHRDADGTKQLDFDVRIYAYAGSASVKIVHTATNRQGTRKGHVPLEALFVELPTVVKSGRALLGAEGGAKTIALGGAGEAYVYAPDSDTITYGGVNAEPAKGKSVKPLNVGWADLSDGTKGLAAGVRWFWQMYPKSVEVTGDGLLRIGLYPPRHKEPIKIYTGVSRTHYVKLVFHEKPDARELAAEFAGLQLPLLALAPPKWYCRDTKAFGSLAENDRALYGEQWPAVKKYNDCFEAAYQRCIKAIDGRVRNGVFRDSYGMLEWGDGYHWALTKGVDHPQNQMWDGNYYGYPHMMAMQFSRTGNLGYLDLFETHALHVADVHIVHHDDVRDGFWVGANRYCPPPEHVRMHDFNDYKKNPVYVSNTFNHHKAQGLFERWYLLADHRMLDVIEELAGFVMRYRDADYDRSQPRGPGFLMITLAEFCDFYAGDKRWLDRARRAFNANKNRAPKQNYQLGFLLEGVRRYYEVSGDPEALAYIKARCDQVMEGRTRTSCNRAHAFGFLYGQTGDVKYRDFGAASVQRCRPGYENCWKDFASDMRSGMFMLYYLWEGVPVAKPDGAD